MNYQEFSKLGLGDVVLWRTTPEDIRSRWSVVSKWSTEDDRPGTIWAMNLPIPAVRLKSMRPSRKPVYVVVAHSDDAVDIMFKERE